MRTDDQGRRLCSAHRQDGEPCNAPAKTGSTVCVVHGARSPQAIEAAGRRKLEELVGPALAALRDLLTEPEVSDSAKATAARIVLDRSGYGPTRQLEVVTEAAIDREIDRLEQELDRTEPGWRDEYGG